MSIIEMLLKELDQESQITRKMLQRVPDDKYDWQPHEKSMTLRQLATHVAELPSWIMMGLTTDELDFATSPYDPVPVNNNAQLLELFEKSLAEGKSQLAAANDEKLEEKWTLRNADEIYSVMTKGEVVRHSLSQTIHHRAQLGVYLRLLNIPIPGTYGPSADEQDF
ncbi:DinB family protein [Arcticibacter tournemirensis]|uniref:DinB family protein n=1 Tax=Arcticibacter tournemirensis TaxID=699437 RepID=A0A4Q0MGC3_9SPHI|nr:DinB family protein [Arcticibacter tournemirensis]RXF72395.1 DinB family protein [Arcticibacter tournemirensis]